MTTTVWEVVLAVLATDACLFVLVVLAYAFEVLRHGAVAVLRLQLAPLRHAARAFVWLWHYSVRAAATVALGAVAVGTVATLMVVR